ncbi:fimbria/pilus periplasmic chaperone [Aeromonas dhakensis]|uniref:fimbria/pilus periplasmic chaperone n=1 Tax=Aeromonas dhakensis TaxID=196024 RepID=UPI0039882F31
MKYHIKLALCFLLAMVMTPLHASVSLDRTRAIYPGDVNSISLRISNNNTRLPYLAQAWLEDAEGNKLKDTFTVLPPIQRLEPNGQSIVKVQALPSAALLPQDKESLFYFNLREIPPRPDNPSVLQLALQTRIKFFYRPARLVVDSSSSTSWQTKMTLQEVGGKYQLTNPTPYYISVVAAARSLKDEAIPEFESVMIAPGSHTLLNLGASVLGQQPSFTYVDDYGGARQLSYQCSTTCTVVGAQK